MAQEEVVKVVRVRGKVSMKGTYWKNQKEDSTGENDFKLKVTKKGRKDYLIIFQRVGGNGYSVSNSIGGSYEVKIGENEEIKSVDELINIFFYDKNELVYSKNKPKSFLKKDSFMFFYTNFVGDLQTNPNGPVLKNFVEFYLEKKGLTDKNADSKFFEIVQDPFEETVPPIPEGYFSIWDEWNVLYKKWDEENKTVNLQQQTPPTNPTPVAPGEKSNENTIDPAKVYTFNVATTGFLYNSDFGTFSLKGEGVVDRDFDFQEVDDELPDEFREEDFQGQDETEAEEALYPMSEERKADLDAESSSLQKNASQKEQEIIKSGKHDLDLIPAPAGKAGYLDNNKNIINLCAIDGSLVNILIAPSFLDMREAAKRDGIIIKVSSGFRAPYDSIDAKSSKGTVVKASSQQYLYDGWIAKKPGFNLAAKPGGSPHGYGIGMDLNTGGTSKARFSNVNRKIYQWLCENSWKYGFVRSVVNEEWHFDYRPENAKKGPYGKIAGTDANKFYSDWGLDKMTAPDWKVPSNLRV